VTKNLGEAVNWYIKASLNNNSDAQYLLAQAYYFGAGVSEDRNEAFVWYKRAASFGNPDAIIALERFASEFEK